MGHFQRIGLLHGCRGLFAPPGLLVDLCQGFVGQDQRGVHGDGLLRILQSLIVAFGFAQGIRQVVVVVGVERIAVDRLAVRRDRLVEFALAIVGRGKLVVALWIVLELLQQRLTGLDRVVVATQAIVRVGQAGVSGGQIVGIKRAGVVDQALVDLARFLITFDVEIGLGQAKAGRVARWFDLHGAGISLDGLIRVILQRAPGAQVFPGLSVIGSDLHDALVRLRGL